MNFRLILKTRVAVWPFSSATYWEDFFECCNVKHISIQTFISKNFSANFFLWLLFALFHCLPIREIFDESDPFQRKDSTSGQNFLKTFDLYPLFCISFSVNSRSLHNSDSNIPLCEFFVNLQKRGCQNPFLAAYQVRGEFQNKYFRMWQFDYNPDLDATKPPFSSATYWAVFFISGVWNVPVSENSLLRPLMNFLWILKNEDVF